MARIHYKVVQHDGGWAYTSDGVFSEPYATHDQALAAARRVVAEQRQPDNTHDIEYQGADGVWHTESARGDDRPEVDVTG
jgi:glycine/D-amino acid oxidase-like deaminating enzyme